MLSAEIGANASVSHFRHFKAPLFKALHPSAEPYPADSRPDKAACHNSRCHASYEKPSSAKG